MKHLVFWFDPTVPACGAAFEQLPQWLEGLSFEVSYRPVWLAALDSAAPDLAAPSQASSHALPLLRLLLACADEPGGLSRRVCEAVLRHAGTARQVGSNPTGPELYAELLRALAPRLDPASGAVEQGLRQANAAAVARGVFDVPTIEVDDQAFVGLADLPMLADHLRQADGVPPG